ncbi:hypothetical protein [Asticcacaulis sp. AC466]|uniref:hypothetical protein n=1 Tax=Asticcacaulis sp. AC466 TaxID=1282362 RepID=UPI0012DCD548|nr:hypothetical protein [Asticcacaulis sp. AC466]
MQNNDLDKMIAMSAVASGKPGWQGLADYLALQGRGVRKRALAELTEFVQAAATWSFDRRLDLCLWLLESLSPYSMPSPLLETIVHPTCREWGEREPDTVIAHLWLGRLGLGVEHYERALYLDPACAEARGCLCEAMIEPVWFNQHHLPDYYINSPAADLLDLAEAEAMWVGREIGSVATQCLKDIHEYRENAQAWLRDHPQGP